MKIRLFLIVLLLSVWASACESTGSQPVFSRDTMPKATAIPMQANPRVVATLASRLISFDVSPDGNVIALATSSGALLYDLHTYRFLRSLNNGELTTSVAWSADGSKLAVGGAKDYGTPFFVGGDSNNSNKAHLTVWDTSTWKIIFEPGFGNEMVNQSFRDLAWSPNGHLLAFSLDLGGVQVLDTQTGQLVSRQGDFAATVTDISWSPDGSRLVANNDLAYGIRRWRVSDDQWVRLFDPRASSSNTVAWSPDGKRIASGHYLGTVCLWTAATNKCDGFIQAHLERTVSLAWSPGSSKLATGGSVIRIWNASTGKLIKAFGQESNFIYDRIEWPAPSGPLVSLESDLANAGATILRLWDISSGAIIAEFRGQ